MAYASPRGIARAQGYRGSKVKLRGIAKHLDDNDARDFKKAPVKKQLGFFARMHRYLFGRNREKA